MTEEGSPPPGSIASVDGSNPRETAVMDREGEEGEEEEDDDDDEEEEEEEEEG